MIIRTFTFRQLNMLSLTFNGRLLELFVSGYLLCWFLLLWELLPSYYTKPPLLPLAR